jgi:prepilin-type N-terminal cleavage/methylation domain-containing protein
MNMRKLIKKIYRLKRSWGCVGLNPDIPGQKLSRVNSLSQKKGFTLIEIIIFIVLAGVLMVAIIAPFLTSVSRSNIPEIAASAAFLAAERLEQLHQVAYLSIANEANAALTGNYTAFSRQVTVTLVDANLAASASDVGYKQVVVTVFHAQLPGAGISVTSLFTNYAG